MEGQEENFEECYPVRKGLRKSSRGREDNFSVLGESGEISVLQTRDMESFRKEWVTMSQSVVRS